MANYKQYAEYPFSFINDFGISNNLTSPNTKIDISAGITNDSKNTFTLNSSNTLTIDSTKIGLNGLDQGILIGSAVYAIHVVWDPASNRTPGAVISTSYANPVLPQGYLASKLIGYCTTNSDTTIAQGYWTTGKEGHRRFTYITAVNVLTGGSSTSFDTIDLSSAVPLIDNTPVLLGGEFSADTPGVAALLSLTNSGAAQFGILSQIAGLPQVLIVNASSLLVGGQSTIQYLLTDTGASLDINVGYYDFSV